MEKWKPSLLALVVCLFAGSLIGLGSYTFWYAEGGSYFSTDPRACANCHVMRESFDSWQRSGHHHVATCNDCHMPHELLPKLFCKAENGFWHSKGFTLQDFHEPIRIKPRNAGILQANCVSCHHGLVEGIVGHGAGAEAKCVHCHLSAGHGPPR